MKIIKVMVLEVVFVISFFLICEAMAQAYFYFKHGYTLKQSFLYENDKDLIYKINNGYKGKHGKYYGGIRKDYFDKDKGNKKRIVCLGGSTTFGHNQFDNAKVWPEILERLLGRDRYETLNAGVAGYGYSNMSARLKKDILGLKPDVVIIFEGWNLAGSVKSGYAWVPDNIYFKRQPLLKKINNFFMANSILYIKMNGFLVSKFIKPENDIIDRVYKREFPVMEKEIKEIADICRRNDIRPVLIKYPSMDYDYRRYKDTIQLIERSAFENNVPLIDCSSYFERLSKDDRASYFTDMAHFSDKGNEKIAEIICKALISGGYLK